MNEFRIAATMVAQIRIDLRRPHAIAGERVGYLIVRSEHGLHVATEYIPLEDTDYEFSADLVGAQFSGAAIKRMLRVAHEKQAGLFNVHEHGGRGRPDFSGVDLRSYSGLVPAFFGMSVGPHGAVLLSEDQITGLVWADAGAEPKPFDRVVQVGFPLNIWSRTDDDA
jgi:hypothetical protein